MKKSLLQVFLILILLSFVLLLPTTSSAHPGRTASDGCHYCRTNCASWGEVQGARHCHGGYTPPVNTYAAPTATLKPTTTPTRIPTPQVLESDDSNDGSGSGLLGIAGLAGVSGLGYYLFRKFKGTKTKD